MFATFMEVLDTTVVNVSLPHIASSMSATTEEATWALTSYLVANAIILPMTGWLAARFGRKRLLMMSTAGSRWRRPCAARRPTSASLVIFRIIQGATGGALQPLSQAVLLEVVQARGARPGDGLLGPRHRGRADPGPGGRRLAHRELLLALGLLHQPAGRHHLAADDAGCSSSIRRTCKRESQGIDYWGMGMLVSASARCSIVLDKGQQDDWFAITAIRSLPIVSAVTLTRSSFTAAVEEPDRRSAAVQGPQLRGRRVPDDGAGLRAVRQPGAAAGDAADAVRLSRRYQAGQAMAPRGIGSLVMMPLSGC